MHRWTKILFFPVLIPGQCELYGDPHYISFQGVDFDFLNQGTYILVEEQSPRHNLTIVVDNFYCVPGLYGSCVKGIILKYQNNVATLTIVPHLFSVQVGYITVLFYLYLLPPWILICITGADNQKLSVWLFSSCFVLVLLFDPDPIWLRPR